jgi:predicted membrane-bound dolichyl-phosphate-mannose-protein mannosyltransferase
MGKIIRERKNMRRLIVGVVALTVALPVAAQSVAAQEQVGRYQIVTSTLSNEIFLLDTAKGAVWQLVQFPELKTKPRGWQPILTVETPAAYEALAKRYGKTSETPPQP